MTNPLKLSFVEMPTPDGGSFSVEGYSIGQLHVHESFFSVPSNWTVSHIKSGCYLARFWKQDDAITFARQSQDVFDYDAYVHALTQGNLNPDWKALLEDVKLLRESLLSYWHEPVSEDVREATIDYLRELVNVQ